MPTAKAKPASHQSAADTSQAVDEFMAQLVHPHKAAIEALRRIVVAVDDSVVEGVKWNAPSFRTSEYFGTTHLRAKSGIALILHLGAKSRALPAGGLGIEDPSHLLTWLGKDRAMVEFADAADVEAKRIALRALLAQWIRCVE